MKMICKKIKVAEARGFELRKILAELSVRNKIIQVLVLETKYLIIYKPKWWVISEKGERIDEL